MSIQVSAAGWRRRLKPIIDFPLVAMVLAIALFVAALAVAQLIGKALPPMADLPRHAIRGGIAIVLVFTTYKLAICKLGQPPRDDLPAKGAAKGLGAGLLLGFLLFSAIVGVAALLDIYNIIGDGGFQKMLDTAIVMAIMPGFMEEMLFRGILFRHLEQFGGSWFALALTSALFGLAHIFNPNASALSSLAIAVEAGVLLGGAYMLTRNLWVPMALHASWNFTQGFVYDVPVSGIDQEGMVEAKLSGNALLSGGAFGLEASLIAMVIATAAGVWLVWRAIRAGEVVRPWWVRRRAALAGGEAAELAAPTV